MRKCTVCGSEDIEAVGQWVCYYGGHVTYKKNVVPFYTLAVGERFYSSHDRPGETRLRVKLYDGVGYNAQFVDMDRPTCGFGPMAMVVRESDVEIEFWNLPPYIKPSPSSGMATATGGPATQKQIAYLIRLNVWHEPTITKREASSLIDAAKTRLVDSTLYAVKPIRATCHICGRTAPVEEMAEGHAYDWGNPDTDIQGSVLFLRYNCLTSPQCNVKALKELVANADEEE